MVRMVTLSGILLMFCTSIFGQNLSKSTIEQSVSDFVPSERVFVHTDRDYYRRGDTIWYRAFLQSEKDEGVSNFVYIDLIDDAQNVVSRHKVKRSIDGFYSQIPVELSYRPGGYTLRAYTYWMLNFDKQTYFYKPIFITSDKLAAEIKDKKSETKAKNITTAIGGDKLTIKTMSKLDQYLAVYNSNALFVIQPLTNTDETFAIETKDLPSGEIVVAILDSKGKVIERSTQMIAKETHTAQIEVNQRSEGDSTLIRLSINAPEGSYSLTVAHSDLIVPFVDIRSLLKNGSTADIENAMIGKAQNLTHYLELEQALVGVVKNISAKKIAKGFQISTSLGGMNEFYTADVDPQTARFQVDLLDVTGVRKMTCKLIEPEGVKVLDCVIELQSSTPPAGYSPFRFSPKPKPTKELPLAKSAAAPETERVINIDSVVVRGRTGRRPYEPFTMDKRMAQFNLVSNYEIYLSAQMDSRTLYEILTINRLLPKYKDRYNPEYNQLGRSGASGGSPFRSIQTDDQSGWIKGKSETGGADGEGSTSMIRANAPVASGPERMPDDWLWTYVLDGTECMPDEGFFEHLLGEDISTIQLVRSPYFMPWIRTLVVAIETKPTKDGVPRRPSRNFAKLDYVGYTVPVDFVYQTRNTLGWKPDLKVGRKPAVVDFAIPKEVAGSYTVALSGYTVSGDLVTFVENIEL